MLLVSVPFSTMLDGKPQWLVASVYGIHLTLSRHCQVYVLHASYIVQTVSIYMAPPSSRVCNNGKSVKQYAAKSVLDVFSQQSVPAAQFVESLSSFQTWKFGWCVCATGGTDFQYSGGIVRQCAEYTHAPPSLTWAGWRQCVWKSGAMSGHSKLRKLSLVQHVTRQLQIECCHTCECPHCHQWDTKYPSCARPGHAWISCSVSHVGYLVSQPKGVTLDTQAGPDQAMLWEARVHTNWALSTLGQECSANTNWALSSLGQEEIWPDQTSSLGACKCETVLRDRERPGPSARSKLTQLTWVSWASKLYKLSRAPLGPSMDRNKG